MQEEGKRVFVTGGTGFIGRSFCKLLREAGYTCYVLSRWKRAAADGCRFIQADISDTARLAAWMQDIRPQVLVHFAWGVDAPDYATSEQNRDWIRWSTDLLRGFLASGGKTVVASGTCFEYDLSGSQPHREDETALRHGDSLYGQCKLETYRRFAALCRQLGARLVWGRIFYPFGPGETPRKFFSQAIRTLAEGREFCCRSPENRIDYVYVEDVARMFFALLQAEAADGAFNIGTGTAVSLRDSLTELAGAMGAADLLRFEEHPGKTIVADMTRTRAFYQGAPRSVSEGLTQLKEAILS